MSDLISRQAAIKAIEDLQDCYNGFSDTYDKACIIGVIEEVPPIEPNSCEYWDRESRFCALCRPQAEPRKHGYFRPAKDGHGCECSECGTAYRWSEADTMKYCKICGARMDGGEE